MPIRSNRLATFALSMLATLAAMPAAAHLRTDEAIPSTEGVRLGLSAALASLSASDRLPSQDLVGYLLLGDAGVDHRGSQLEHGVAQFGYRFNPWLGAQLAVGAHGSDPVHIESALLQGRGRLGATEWTLNAGRQSPTLGATFDRAGHLDRFGLMPLAKQAVLNGDWIEDGAEFSLQQQAGDVGWRVDAAAWSGRKFPGAPGTAVFPSLHVGVNWDGFIGQNAIGEITLDAFAARLKPQGRGSRLSNALGGHSHATPVCDERLQEVVCFDGRSRVSGLSVQWASTDESITLTGALMWRQEEGSLQSRNGIGDYRGRTHGGWQEGLWRVAPQWELGARHERLIADQSLIGPGARELSAEARIGDYAPQRRITAMLGYLARPWADLRFEWGREKAGTQGMNFVALRLTMQWDGTFSTAAP